jgi:hypothetical protein
MINFASKLAVLALLGAPLASATPARSSDVRLARRLEVIPEKHDISHIAIDETNGQYIAYRKDWSVYGVVPFNAEKGLNGTTLPITKRDATGTCSDLSVQEAQTSKLFTIFRRLSNLITTN